MSRASSLPLELLVALVDRICGAGTTGRICEQICSYFCYHLENAKTHYLVLKPPYRSSSQLLLSSAAAYTALTLVSAPSPFPPPPPPYSLKLFLPSLPLSQLHPIVCFHLLNPSSSCPLTCKENNLAPHKYTIAFFSPPFSFRVSEHQPGEHWEQREGEEGEQQNIGERQFSSPRFQCLGPQELLMALLKQVCCVVRRDATHAQKSRSSCRVSTENLAVKFQWASPEYVQATLVQRFIIQVDIHREGKSVSPWQKGLALWLLPNFKSKLQDTRALGMVS